MTPRSQSQLCQYNITELNIVSFFKSCFLENVDDVFHDLKSFGQNAHGLTLICRGSGF